ncbi:MAG: hypothetical protein QG573_2095 [Acidobacteriota bacterium]|nr:hypothetical protein [Acidobacteriota bacterium]
MPLPISGRCFGPKLSACPAPGATGSTAGATSGLLRLWLAALAAAGTAGVGAGALRPIERDLARAAPLTEP